MQIEKKNPISVLSCNLSDHEVENAPVAVVGQLQVGVEPHDDGELESGVSGDGEPHPGGQTGGQLYIELLLSGEAKEGGGLTLQVLQRNDAHTNQVTPVNPLIALGNDCSYPQEERSLGGPVPAGAAAIILPCQNDEVSPSLGVLLSCVEHIKHGARGDVNSLGCGLPYELVDQPDIPEGSPRHHSVVSSPGPEAVEVPRCETLAVQEPGRRGLPGDGAGRRDVVRRHGVPEVQQSVCLSDGRLDRQL